MPAVAARAEITVMVYICGADLSDCAESDIAEMVSAGIPANGSLNLLLTTGGAKRWSRHYGISRTSNQFHLVTEDGLETLESIGDRNMGEADTLSEFIQYGYANYPADRYVLILWDHGGGPLGGVCIDYKHGRDALMLDELERALQDGIPSGETLDMLCMDDSFLIKTVGYGLKLLDYPDVMPLAIDPWLLHAMNIEEKDGKLIIPVAKKVPACLMGSGKGRQEPGYTGDADIITTDKELTEQYGLNDLRFGDIVMIEDFDSSYGRGYHKGAVTIGCIIHGDTYTAGHGPGVTSLLTCKKPIIEGRIDEKANLAYLFGVNE